MLVEMLPFTGNPLDRRAEKRNDALWIAEKLRAGRVLPLRRLEVLVAGGAALEAARVPQAEVSALAAPEAACVFLGLEGEAALFALDVSADTGEAFKAHGTFRDLRGAAPLLALADLAILSTAKAVIDWHARHGFCPRCGGPSAIADAGWKRVCARCGAEHFPRTDPAVIMLAVHGEECLLARNKNWAPDFLSALAGFVEPGESFEEAVRRELYEEAGVIADQVTYIGSQPWPFPYSIMVGCFAECESKALKLDPNEIAEAEWLTRSRALDLLEGRVPGRRGPFAQAIAHHLIRRWATSGI